MLVVVYVAKLVAYDSCVAYRGINVCMRMAVNPCIEATIGNIVAQFCSESSVQDGTHVLSSHNLQCRQMMSDNNNMLGGTILSYLFQES